MIGSPSLGAWIAQIAFWVLVALAVSHGVLGKKAAALFVAIWLAGYIGVPRISWWTWPLVTPYVAVLDIILVFIVFKGDVRLT